jgi:hypothetical protein
MSQHLTSTSRNSATVIEIGAIAAQAAEILAPSQAEVDSILGNSFTQLEGIINAVESLLPEFDGFEAVNNELVLLSDILTTVEEAVQRRE